MKAKVNTECDGCGNPSVYKGTTFVRYDRDRVVACEVCDPTLADEAEVEDGTIHVLRFRVLAPVFSRADGGFSIYRVALEERPVPSWVPPGAAKAGAAFSLCGPVGNLTKGDVVVASGRFTTSPKYGLQFDAVSQAQPAIVDSEAGLRAFLSKLPNVGPVRAYKILEQLGSREAVIAALENEPLKLTCVEGITPERADEIKAEYDRVAKYRDFRLWASSLGMTENIISAAIDLWDEDARVSIEANPYELIQFPRVGFKRADEIASKMQISSRDPRRLAAGLLAAIQSLSSEGDTFVLHEDLLNPPKGRSGDDVRRLGLTAEELEEALSILTKDRECRGCSKCKRAKRDPKLHLYPPALHRYENGRIYLAEIDHAEQSVAGNLIRLLGAEVPPISPKSDVWRGLTPAPEQVEALRLACSESVVILTGGPGTGKSQTTRAILDVLEGSGLTSQLCAPTGKAAIRLSQLSGRKAETIHRALAHSATSSDSFTLSTDVLVVDEFSMVDVELASRLFNAVQTGTRVLLVGDVDQLPSIGPGQVLRDLIDSNVIPSVRLTKIFRQQSDGATKRIPEVARAIIDGACPDVYQQGTDVVFLGAETPEEIQEKIVWAVTERIPEKYGFRPEEIQVMSPQHGELGKISEKVGTRFLNYALQERLNPKLDVELHIGDGYVARVNDRVVQTKNNYELQVMNGEQGIVTRCEAKPFAPPDGIITSAKAKRAETAQNCERCQGTAEIKDMFGPRPCSSCQKKRYKDAISMIVDYGDGRVVGYETLELRELQLAYALTVHKMQGSQSRAVVIPLHSSLYYMSTSQNIYTAVTRAEQYVLFVGQAKVVERIVKNRRGETRKTTQIERLAEAFGEQLSQAERLMQTLNSSAAEVSDS